MIPLFKLAEKALGVLPGVYKYFTSFWNFLDIVMIGSIYISSIYHLYSLQENNKARCFLAIANILVWCKFMYFARSNAKLGPLIAMIVQICSDIGPFLTVLTTILFGYALSFWILTYGNFEGQTFDTIGGTLLNSYVFMLGGFDPTQFAGSPVEGFAVFLSVIFMLIVSIILLNLLIAIMGNSYGIVQEHTKQQYRWEQAASIVDCIDLLILTPSDERKAEMDPAQIQFVTRDSTFAKGGSEYVDIDGLEDETDAVVTDHQLELKLNHLQNKLVKHETVKFAGVNDKIATLNTLIEQKINAVSSRMDSLDSKMDNIIKLLTQKNADAIASPAKKGGLFSK